MPTIADLIAQYGSLANAPLPAGMRNNNPGNLIWYPGAAGLPGVVGPSINTDNAGANHQIVFDSPESGMAAAARLALRKYNAGKTTANDLVAGQGGWTPGNYDAAANIARSAGTEPNADLSLDNPARMQRFMRGLITQEHGAAGRLYPDELIAGAASGARPVASAFGVGSIRPVSPLDPQYRTASGVTYPGSSDPKAIGTGRIDASFIPKAADPVLSPTNIAGETAPAPEVTVTNLPNPGLGAAFASALGSLVPKQQAYSTAPLQNRAQTVGIGPGISKPTQSILA